VPQSHLWRACSWATSSAAVTSTCTPHRRRSRTEDRPPHVVLSTTLNGPTWKTARVVRGVEDVRALKAGAGKDIFVVGGASLVSTLMNHELIEELRLVVHPLVLGRGKPLFKNVTDRHQLQLIAADPEDSGLVVLRYRTQGGPTG
jgi:dihydrofolate reductase